MFICLVSILTEMKVWNISSYNVNTGESIHGG